MGIPHLSNKQEKGFLKWFSNAATKSVPDCAQDIEQHELHL